MKKAFRGDANTTRWL